MMRKGNADRKEEYRQVKEEFSRLNRENKKIITRMIADLLADQKLQHE